MHKRDISVPTENGRNTRPSREFVTDPASDELDDDQVRRWAEVIVKSSESITHFSACNRRRVEAEVRRILRQRLLRFIARTIAHDIVTAKDTTGDQS